MDVFQPATLLKLTLLHGCFSHFLNCTIEHMTKILCSVAFLFIALSVLFNVSLFHEIENFKYKNSRIISKQLTNLIINQDPIYTVNLSEVSKLKRKK